MSRRLHDAGDCWGWCPYCEEEDARDAAEAELDDNDGKEDEDDD